MKLRTSLLVAVMLLFTSGLFAQSAAEIEAAKAMARSYGYSESEINAMINGNSGGGSQAAAPAPTVNRNGAVAGSQGVVLTEAKTEEPALKIDQKDTLGYTDIFGHSIFKSKNLNFVPSYNIPTPKSYILGAGDELVIDIWGAVYSNFMQEISPEGSITIPNLGPVYVLGQTIEQATKQIKGHLSQIYSGLSGDNPNTFIRVTLGSIRSLTINVIGDVENPGTYTVPSLSTVFSAVHLAGGPNANGSVRNIGLYRNNKLVKTLDVYDFIQKGKFDSNLRLEENDLIKVNIYDNIVSIQGEVKRPMRYELKESENLKDLLELAGGYSATANVDRAHVVRTKGERTQSFDVAASQFESFDLLNGDVVTIPSNIEDNKNNVYITGAVWHPGTYSISDTLSNLRELIIVAGGLRDDAYTERGYIEREDERRQMTALNFSVEGVMNGTQDVLLVRNDSIRIFSIPELEKLTKVNVYGEVNTPSALDFRKGMTLGDAILLCGGYTVGAAQSNVEVARRNVNDGSMVASETVATIYNFNLLQDAEGLNFELAPYDQVFVRTAPDYKKQQLITVDGEVNFPGNYVIPSNTVRLSEVISKAGGLNLDAYAEGATVTRVMTEDEMQRSKAAALFAANKLEDEASGNTYKIGIDLVKALENPGSYYDLILRSGDIINIPKANNTVTISGGVLYQNTVSYDPGMKLRDYIAQAGGYLKEAKKNGVYIVYMNGTVSTKKHGNLKVRPGCEIIVPVKNMENRQKMSASEVMSIATSAASLATMTVSIVNMVK